MSSLYTIKALLLLFIILSTSFDKDDLQARAEISRAQKVPKASKHRAVEGELLVSIPLSIFLPSLLSRDRRREYFHRPLNGRRRSSGEDVLDSLGFAYESWECRKQFVCEVFSKPRQYRPLSDILYVAFKKEGSEAAYEDVLNSRSRSSACLGTKCSSQRPPNINLRALRRWQNLSKYYPISLSTHS